MPRNPYVITSPYQPAFRVKFATSLDATVREIEAKIADNPRGLILVIQVGFTTHLAVTAGALGLQASPEMKTLLAEHEPVVGRVMALAEAADRSIVFHPTNDDYKDCVTVILGPAAPPVVCINGPIGSDGQFARVLAAMMLRAGALTDDAYRLLLWEIADENGHVLTTGRHRCACPSCTPKPEQAP